MYMRPRLAAHRLPGPAAWAAACNLGVGDGTPGSALTTRSPEEGSSLGAWRIKAFLAAALVTMKIKIFTDNLPPSGDGWAQNRAVFPLAVTDPQDGESRDKHRLFTTSRAAQRDTAAYSFPFLTGTRFWKAAQRNKGGFLSSVSLVLGGVQEIFFFPLRDGASVLW